MRRATQTEAFDALADPNVPMEDALKMFKQAYRRSNDATKAFVLHFTGLMRTHKSSEIPVTDTYQDDRSE